MAGCMKKCPYRGTQICVRCLEWKRDCVNRATELFREAGKASRRAWGASLRKKRRQ